MKPLITAEQLRSSIFYTPETGDFVRLKSSQGAKAGLAGVLRPDGYLCFGIHGRQYLSHRLAWLYVYGEWPEGVIDHINGSRNDNRISNLRSVSWQINLQNQTKATRKNKSSLLLGVTFRKATKNWRAEITVPCDGPKKSKRLNLGVFQSPELAHEAYLKAKRALHVGCTI